MVMDKDIFFKNMDILQKKFPDIFGKISNACGNHIDVTVSKQGGFVPCFARNDGKNLFIHSRVDPQREADRFVEELSLKDKDLIVILGFGFGYHVEAILEKNVSNANIIVIEHDALIFKKFIEFYNLPDFFFKPNFSILIDPAEDELLSYFKGKSSRNVLFVTHRGSHQIYPEYYSNIASILKSYISTKDVNIATLAKFEKTWSSNIARNIGIFANSCGANIFYDRFKGLPAIVVAAGPSLTISLPFIRENLNKAVIIAVDTSYKILVRNGIIPHFCLSVDPQIINARYFEGIEDTSTMLIADPMVHPSTFRFFKGELALSGIAFDMMKWIESICGNKGELSHGGSVSTNAYDFAKRIGASPVIFVGQDLSFTNGLAHAKGSYLDEQIHNKTFRLNTAEMFNRRQLTFLPKIFLPGIKSKFVHTNQKMIIFINWFQNRKDPEIINATIDGVRLSGINHIEQKDISLKDIDFDVKKEIERIYIENKNKSFEHLRESLLKKIDKMLEEIESLIPALERAISLSEELLKLIDGGIEKEPGKVNYILGKLSDTDKFIETKKEAKDIISFSIQRVIHTITEGYDIDGESDANVAKKSHFLYKGLLEGATFNKKILLKMKRML